MISLFAGSEAPRRGVSSIVLSSGLHAVGFCLLSYGILKVPRIEEPIITERYSVRHLDLHSPELREETTGNGESLYPPTDAGRQGDPQGTAAASRPAPTIPEVPQGHEGKQTLVQPEFHAHVALSEEAPVPTVVIWTPELASTKEVVAPLPDKPSKADFQASLDTPNEELDQGSLAMTAADTQPVVKTPPAGTTSPLVVRANSVIRMAPATVSNSADQPTPTAVLSLSDMRMTEGTIILPPVNETHSMARKNSTAQPAAPAPRGLSDTQGSSEEQGGRTGEGGNKSIAADSFYETTEHIQRPKDGKFGVVVVGTSLDEEYPEALQIWSNRVAYTAYLHVGLTKNWILQYAQLRSAEASANGAVTRVEAPWPYDIMRPNLVSRDLNADALMVHGILNESGRLESLAIAFPEQFSHAAFVLRALQRWQFRPARRLGKPTAVEILLIIPDESD